MASLLIHINFFLFLAIFTVALTLNRNFNTVLVGLTYMAPLIPHVGPLTALGLGPEITERFLLISCANLIFGTIEIVVFVLTVEPGDTPFDKEHLEQLFGHTLPIVVALVGLSFLGRANAAPVTALEFTLIAILFICGAVLRVVAIYQIGSVAFKFDIVFRQEQRLKTDQLYGLVRHPSYTSMMIVVLSYAVIAHSFVWGAVGIVTAWAGFQYRIHHEETALAEKFGEEYQVFRAHTGMWLPRFTQRKI